MLRDFVLELVAAPSNGATITLTGIPPTGRVSWSNGFAATSQPVFYTLDDSIQQEWGVGQLTIGTPSVITRPTIVLGNSAGTTARLTFSATTRCYSGLPSSAVIGLLNGGVPRNLFHNPMDRIAQRGAGPFTVGGMMSDRWGVVTGTGGGTRSITVAALTDVDRTAIGDQEARNAVQYVFSGGSAAGDYDLFLQRLEDLRRTAGKTVTVSFWAKAAAGTPKIGVGMQQIFGTGGSPSAIVLVAAQTVTLSTTWTRYSLTFTVPSVNGKTFGTTSPTDYLEVDFWLSSGTTFNSQSGSIGVQAATVTLFGRQIEIGSYATPLEKQDVNFDYAQCRRFFQNGLVFFAGYGLTGTQLGYQVLFPMPMRIAPTVVCTGGLTNLTSLTISQVDYRGFVPNGAVTATGNAQINTTFTASADL